MRVTRVAVAQLLMLSFGKTSQGCAVAIPGCLAGAGNVMVVFTDNSRSAVSF